MAYVKKPLKAKIEKYQADENRKPQSLSYAPLIGGKYLHLQVGDTETTALKISGLRLAIGYEGFLIGSCLPTCVNSLFDLNHIKEGKPDTDGDKAYLEAWMSAGCFFLLDPTGNGSLEALSSLFNDVFFDLSDFQALTTISDEHTKLLKELKDWQLEFSSNTFDDDWSDYGKFMELWGKDTLYPAIYLSEDDFKPKRGKPITHPDYQGHLPTPIKITEKIELPAKGKSEGKKYGSSKPAYMPTLTRLEDILGLLNNEKAKELYQAYLADPSYVTFLMSLTGLPISSSYLNHAPVTNNVIEVQTVDLQEEATKEILDNQEVIMNIAYRLIEAFDNPAIAKEFNVEPAKQSSYIADLIEDLKAIKNNPEAQEVKLRDVGFASKLLTFFDDSAFPSRECKTAIKTHGINKPVYAWSDEDLLTVLEKLNILAF